MSVADAPGRYTSRDAEGDAGFARGVGPEAGSLEKATARLKGNGFVSIGNAAQANLP